jgi:hypothetical protein
MMPEATVVCFYDSMPSLCSPETNGFLCFNICKEKGVQKSVCNFLEFVFVYSQNLPMHSPLLSSHMY